VNTLAKKIETLANVSIIVVAVLLCVVLVKTYFLHKAGESVDAEGIALGHKLNLPEVNWSNNRQTMLIGLSTECHFCTESAPFYMRLSRDHANARLIAVFPQSVQESGEYLKKLGVTVDQVKQVSLGSIGIAGTPTLILVDHEGIVTNIWAGKLTPDQEKEVLTKLANSAS
jgi:thiol-disulfide isomerase/thioredoxin